MAMTLSDILGNATVTQVELARRIGVHPVTVTVWKRNPPRDVVAPAIAAATGQPLEVVLAAIREARAAMVAPAPDASPMVQVPCADSGASVSA